VYPSNRAGMTLVEVALASAILGALSVASLSWLELLAQGARAPEFADRLQTSRRKLESVLDPKHCRDALRPVVGSLIQTELISTSTFKEVPLAKIVLPVSGESVVEEGRKLTSQHLVRRIVLQPLVASSEVSGGALPTLDTHSFHAIVRVVIQRFGGYGAPEVSWEIPIIGQFTTEGVLTNCRWSPGLNATSVAGVGDLAALAQGFGIDLEGYPLSVSGVVNPENVVEDESKTYYYVEASKSIGFDSKEFQTNSYLQLSFGGHARVRGSDSSTLRLKLEILDASGVWRSCSGSGTSLSASEDSELSATCVTTLPPGQFKARFRLLGSDEKMRVLRAWGTVSLTSLGQPSL
jgi:hypothetical protein